MYLLAANGAVQNSGKRNQDESVLERRVGSGPKGGPSPKREGGGRHVANGELHYLLNGVVPGVCCGGFGLEQHRQTEIQAINF